jgi:hypothetical protein
MTLLSGVSFVETLLIAAELTGDRRFVQSSAADPYFAPATTFVSYGWHGTEFGSLCDALGGLPNSRQGAVWLDIFAIAQNQALP